MTCTATATSSSSSRERPDAEREAALRDLHRAIPHGEGHWCGHLEGSYAVADDLRSVAGLGAEWLYVDHGWDEMSWSDHCNQPWTRWILREHGITLVGPCPEELVDRVPDDVLRDAARAGLASITDDVLGWCPPDMAWCQRYLVVQAAGACTRCGPDRSRASGTHCAGR